MESKEQNKVEETKRETQDELYRELFNLFKGSTEDRFEPMHHEVSVETTEVPYVARMRELVASENFGLVPASSV
jgi:hypothetical protein